MLRHNLKLFDVNLLTQYVGPTLWARVTSLEQLSVAEFSGE